MPLTVRCPNCDCPIKADERLDGKYVKCPRCKKTFLQRIDVPQDDTIQSDSPLLVPEADESPAAMAGAKRFLSLPWLTLIFIVGFLPWSEVGCSSGDFNWRVSQSGYQALYGGVSSPFDSLEVAKLLSMN
jgi:hypothetical protein